MPDAPLWAGRLPEIQGNLSDSSTRLNASSDRLTACVQDLEQLIKGFHLGVSAGIAFRSKETVTDEIWYGKTNGKWGFSIKTRISKQRADEDVESWPFCDAPRHLRVLAVPFIPDLLDRLVIVALAMAKEIDAAAEHLIKINETLKAEEEKTQ